MLGSVKEFFYFFWSKKDVICNLLPKRYKNICHKCVFFGLVILTIVGTLLLYGREIVAIKKYIANFDHILQKSWNNGKNQGNKETVAIQTSLSEIYQECGKKCFVSYAEIYDNNEFRIKSVHGCNEHGECKNLTNTNNHNPMYDGRYKISVGCYNHIKNKRGVFIDVKDKSVNRIDNYCTIAKSLLSRLNAKIQYVTFYCLGFDDLSFERRLIDECYIIAIEDLKDSKCYQDGCKEVISVHSNPVELRLKDGIFDKEKF